MALVAACGGDATQAGKPGAKKERPAARASAQNPAPAATPAEFRYQPDGKRDPFVSYVKYMKRVSAGGVSTPLERFDLSQLELEAVIWGTARPRALIKDPSGKGYIVAEGTPIGKNDGRIVRIQDGGLVVKETYVDFLGKATTKDIEIRLPARKKGG
jgi:type IV pilus assembly protein PilP